MKKLYFLLLLFIGVGLSFNAKSQNFKAKQKSQERTIKSAHRNGKITDREYYKLMDEQKAIKKSIIKYAADYVWTPHEKNVIHDKLVRAEKRLRRYKANGEVY